MGGVCKSGGQGTCKKEGNEVTLAVDLVHGISPGVLKGWSLERVDAVKNDHIRLT
jgi:F0F1-type ATP synthase assembly protein I